MKSRTAVKEKKQETPISTCRHYWLIEAADGPESRGVCKYCGEIKDFSNSMPDFGNMRRRGNPLTLPKMADVEVDEENLS